MADIRLFTIPYSGTRFTKQILRQHGVQVNHQHILIGTYVDADTFNKAIVTLRDPILSRISAINHMDGQEDYKSHPVWLWRQVIRMDKDPRIHFFQVDNPRENELELLSDFVGVKLQANWTPVGAYPDKMGYKQPYLKEGIIPDCLKDDANMLNVFGAREFFLNRGYELPWMWNIRPHRPWLGNIDGPF